ncbi:MAG: metal-binding protein [Archangium gephyra]|uniref:Metal-binding protein n=1 Tax=Archangium gephyra TaxID=48 RepID=A0A2W5SZL8_9BACT|nr:MAG: metal-binding protein [Archangium gephyra]
MTFRLLGANGKFYESATKGTLGGNSRAKVFGTLSCTGALRALAKGDTYKKHRVFFADEATARAAGYRPCGNCLREKYREWKLT